MNRVKIAKLMLLGCISLLILSCDKEKEIEETKVNEYIKEKIIKLKNPTQSEIDKCIENYTRKGYKIKFISSAATQMNVRLYIYVEKEN